MLSSVLTSDRAVAVNIQIMQIFARIRQMLANNTEVRLEIAEVKNAVEKISRKQEEQDKNIELIFQYIDRLSLNGERQKKAAKIRRPSQIQTKEIR